MGRADATKKLLTLANCKINRVSPIKFKISNFITVSQALKLATAKLNAKKIDNPPLEAEILLSGILKKPREFSLAHGEKELSQSQISEYQRRLERRLKGEPVAYLNGYKEFYGLNFMVNKNVLVPRPETELMVEEAMKLITYSSQLVTLIDVGTGSGCIIITLAKLLNQESGIRNQELIGIDISAKALTVAKKNAKLHSVDKNIEFIQGHLIEPLFNSKNEKRKTKIFLANLPYGWKAWKNNYSLDSIGLKFEPPIALFTGENGLELYKKLFRQILTLTAELSAACQVLCEFDPRQTKLMKKLLKQELPQIKYQIKKDLAGLNRLALITIPAQPTS